MAAVGKVLVIGGGFSGMAAAIQMRKVGIAVDLVEIDPDWRPLGAGITINGFVTGISQLYGAAIGTIFVLTLLASGLSASALGTIAGQVIMEGLIGKHWNIWARRIVTRFVNVFPTTLAILLGIDPLHLLVYSQVVLSLLIPLPIMPSHRHEDDDEGEDCDEVPVHVTSYPGLLACT